MRGAGYMHGTLAAVPRRAPRDGFVVVGDREHLSPDEPMQVALTTLRLARRLGVGLPSSSRHTDLLPYDSGTDNVVFDAPLVSFVTGARIRYLRGWSHYQSCVKGWNALGLVADLVLRDLRRLATMPVEERQASVREFVASRSRPTAGDDASLMAGSPLPALDDLDLALWRVCARRTIVCSTSSNMGIALHEVLRSLQRARVSLGGHDTTVLDDVEARLLIWCPDEDADFMHPDKTAVLRALAAEHPSLTTLRTYINRRLRDPGALRDALILGGYFFPTNPQSQDELQNLLANALRTLAGERSCHERELLEDPCVRFALDALGCVVEGARVVVRRGIEGGLHGLMLAYLLMLEETLPVGDAVAISTWNQASIGAALAAAVLADRNLREYGQLSPDVHAEMARLLPRTAAWLERCRLGVDVTTRIHGVFDLANLQSLAQLLGVVVENHLSGRGTAYVGLGSSSYANGNRCYEILDESDRGGGPFHGKSTFHPATHTLNPVAQALVVADDLYRVSRVKRLAGISREAAAGHITAHVRKPEPAGAAALAGYLLSRLDSGTLSVAEIAYVLRLAGFSAELFLELAGYRGDAEGAGWYVQEASEEGTRMEGFAQALLDCLAMDLDELEALAADERRQSEQNYAMAPLAPPAFEALQPVVNIYLTGDNTQQPGVEFMQRLHRGMLASRSRLAKMLDVTAVGAPDRAGRTHELRARATPGAVDLVEHVAEIFRRNADRTFLVDTIGGRTVTYRELHADAVQVARLLRRHGVGRGDRAALLLPNGATFAAAYFGCLMLGAVAVPLNPALTPPEIVTILGLARARLVLVGDALAGRLGTFVPGPATSLVRVSDAPGTWRLDDPDHGSEIVPFVDVQPDDLFVILFTSGTTASPKGVAHTIASELGNAIAFNSVMGFDRDHRFHHVWPMAYSSGLLNTLLSPFLAEGSVVLAHPFDARTPLAFWLPVIEHEANVLWLSPTMMAALLSVDRDHRGPAYCRARVRAVCCGTAPLPSSLRERFERAYGVELLESYGLTELLICTTNSRRYARRDRSVGQPLPGVHIQLGPPEGDEETVGAEVLVATPFAMAGCVDSGTGEIVPIERDALVPTGDLGRMDGEGNLYITGRKKDLILRGGLTVSPAAVRDVLLRHEAVEDAVVVGIPHEFHGEEVAVALRLRSGRFLDGERASLLALCRANLQGGAVPTRLLAVEHFPTGSSGKVLSRLVKDLFGARR